MSASPANPDVIRRQRPEWSPWLAVIEAMARDIGAPEWELAVPGVEPRHDCPAPLLAGAAVTVPIPAAERLRRRLVRTAAASRAPKLAAISRALGGRDVVALFAASLRQDQDDAANVAAESGVDAEAFGAVAALLAVPFLHACRRQWAARLPESWVEGWCPVCGSWPAFTEVRGIERTRHHRCGRCGSEWHARLLHCPYCATADHESLATLAPEASSNASIEACRRCRGYVKTFTRLQRCPPESVLFEDMTTVDLDVAAIEHGFARPAGAGFDLRPSITGEGRARRLLAWRS